MRPLTRWHVTAYVLDVNCFFSWHSFSRSRRPLRPPQFVLSVQHQRPSTRCPQSALWGPSPQPPMAAGHPLLILERPPGHLPRSQQPWTWISRPQCCRRSLRLPPGCCCTRCCRRRRRKAGAVLAPRTTRRKMRMTGVGAAAGGRLPLASRPSAKSRAGCAWSVGRRRPRSGEKVQQVRSGHSGLCVDVPAYPLRWREHEP